MSYILKTNLANRGNYGTSRDVSDIKYIVIHYTANDGDTDENNGTYFHRSVVKVSSHYFVDSDSVTQSVPEGFIAWHCGTNRGYKHPLCRNANSISIEICDDVKNGTVYPSQATIDNAIELTKVLMSKYNIPQANVIRHYDVTGKLCPAYWAGDTAKNTLWKSEFWNKLVDAPKVEPAPVVNASSKINKGDLVKIASNATYYNGSKIPNWVKNQNWYVKQVTRDRAVIGKNQSGNSDISSPINVVYLTNVSATPIATPAPTPAPAPQPVVAPAPAKKSVDEVAKEIIAGKGNWGAGNVRKANLEKQGYDYAVVQSRVNALLKCSSTPAPVKTINVGSSVYIESGAKTYTGSKLASFVYKRKYKVKELRGDRAVLTYGGVVICAVNKANLILA